MSPKYNLVGMTAVFALTLFNCGQRHTETGSDTFTRADSLTETYLAMQDTVLQAWNMMINDDNKKIKAMHNILHELKMTSPEELEMLRSFEERLDQLVRLRYNQKTMANSDVVEEYDFASNSLVTELISLAESRTEFPYNTTLQRLADDIISADQRVNNYREQYDLLAADYNLFILENRDMLKEMEGDSSVEAKPLFQMTTEE